MSQRHLTDDQLQDYLDNNISETDPIAVHLKECSRCQQSLAFYRNLYSAMEEEPTLELSPEFANAVMERLPEKLPTTVTETPSHFHIKDSLVFFIGVAAVLAAAIYFLNPDILTKPLTASFGASQVPENQLLSDVNGYLSQFNIGTATIIFAILTFVGIGVIDRIIVRRKHQQKPISYLV